MSQQASSSRAESSRAGRVKRNSRVAASDSEDDESPVLEHGRKKRRVIAETQEAQDDQADEDGDSDLLELDSQDGTAHDKGKGRANGNGHVGSDEEDVQDGDERLNGEENEDGGGALAFRPEYDRDPKDNFVAGAIVRIKCKGFMTYDLVEFRPGPHLNMILGPNGTGKSTIAAAIAIGLGFPPKVMGRANDLKAYVKQGSERAETEIELKGKRGKRNITIKRCFQRGNDTSDWFLNGSPSTFKAAKDAVLAMGIQANNLCSFLPQDKVAEFAKMAPVTVLRETMRAAGDPRLSRWHDELCEKGANVKVLSEALEKDVTKRDNLQSSVDRMAPDVEHYHAREAQEKERDILSVLIHFAEGTVLFNKGSEIKKRRTEARERKNAIKNRQKPFADLQTFHQKKNQQLDKKMTEASSALGEFTKQYKACQKKVKDANAAREEVDESLAELKSRIARREKSRKTQMDKIEGAQRVLKMPQDELKRAYKDKEAEMRAVDVKQDEIKAKLVALEESYQKEGEQLRQKQMLIANKSKQLENLSSLEKQREQDARDFDASIDFVLNWINENQMTFEGKIHKPPMISVNMRDKGLAAQVEACTSVQQRKTFICENENDYKRIMDLLNKPIPPSKTISRNARPGATTVRINAQIVEVTDAALNPPRPAAPEQASLQKLGFEGWAIDFVDAEPAVIAFLNVNCGLHRAAVTRRPAGQIIADHVTRCGIRTWVTGGDSNRAAYSNYGRREPQITSVPLPPARAFQRVVNTEAIKAITEEIGQLRREERDAEGPFSDKKKKLDEAKEANRTLRAKMDKISNEVKELRDKLVKFRRAHADIELAQSELRKIDAEPSKEEERDRLRDKKMQAVRKLLSPINLQAEAWAEEVDVLESQIRLHLQSFQTGANVEAIAAKVDEDDAEAREAQDAWDQEFEENKHQYLQAVKVCRDGLEALPPEMQEEVNARRPDAVVENVRAQLEQVINDLELSAGVDPAFIARYNKMKEELDGYAENVRRKEKDLAIVKRQVEKTLGMFNPALDALVGVVSTRFGAAFERVGCSGEVKINRVGDKYAEWGINILVSYRDNDALQLLTGSLQSGGERSLATVTYLMSLSEMARTPFSLVDEINQGMDQRAERNVHNQLVEVTCATDAGQYFLITPKLLTGLRYHKNMKVLIVNNGTWLPDTSDKTQRFGDMLGCLQKHQRVLAAA